MQHFSPFDPAWPDGSFASTDDGFLVEDLAPTMTEVSALGALTFVMSLLYLAEGYLLVAIGAPILMAAMLGAAIWHLVRRFPAATWTPVFGFRLGAMVYFGLGSLVPYFADAYSMDWVLGFYETSNEEAAKVQLIWLVFVFMIIGGARGALLFVRLGEPVRVTPGPDRTVYVGVGFFAIGLAYILLIDIPRDFGLLSLNIPAAAANAAFAMHAVGVFLISLMAFDRGAKGYALVLILALFSALLGLILMNKSVVVFPVLLILLAWLMRGVTPLRIVVASGILVVLFGVLQPLVAYQRDRQSGVHGNRVGIYNPGERLAFASEWLSGNSLRPSQEGEVNAYLRLNYVPPAAFVIARYDQHQPSETISQSLSAITPRLLWPDKPDITAVGGDIYYLATGQVGSQIAPTIPADIYWNLGWAGLIILSGLLGPLMMLGTIKCYQIVLTRDWLLMPFVLLCFRLTLSIDNVFVAGLFAPMVIALLIYWTLAFARGVLPGFTAKAPLRPVAR